VSAPAVEVDIRRALERLAGDEDLLGYIVQFVIEDSPALMGRIETGLVAGRYFDVEWAAHSLRGLVSNVHCESIQKQALEIERSAHDENRDAISTALPVLAESLREMLLKLDRVRSQIGSPESPPPAK
jgi:HPt (histidine-containing phosphotransfer) domain-containing protein